MNARRALQRIEEVLVEVAGTKRFHAEMEACLLALAVVVGESEKTRERAAAANTE